MRMLLTVALPSNLSYFAEDAARIGASLSGALDREAEAVRRAVIQRADTS